MSSNEVALLLREAERLLDGAAVSASGNAARLAAFVARQAVEALIDERLTVVGADSPYASVRSRVAILKSLDDRDRTAEIEFAWNRLSACCHHHAYELAPTVSEVKMLCVNVAELIATESYGAFGP